MKETLEKANKDQMINASMFLIVFIDYLIAILDVIKKYTLLWIALKDCKGESRGSTVEVKTFGSDCLLGICCVLIICDDGLGNCS